MSDTRGRGIAVYPMPEAVSGPTDHYALLLREDGEMRMVHSEGVAYVVSNEKPWRWSDFWAECPVFTPSELLIFACTTEAVDLADWVRTFGARLESNFAQISHWAKDVA